MVSASDRRQAVEFVRARGMSIRRACALYQVARSSLRYESKLKAKDAPATSTMRELSAQYPRYGYRKIRIFLARAGHKMSVDRAHRLWRQEGLQVPKKRPRRRLAASRPRPVPATGPNQVWAYDFVHDACANGQKIKCLTLVDEWTHECLAIDVAGSIRSTRLIELLGKTMSVRGAPKYLRSDNGPEFIATKLLKWLTDAGVETAFIPPGKPWNNGTDESFNGKFRDECLNMEWFRSRVEAVAMIETWRNHYNEVRPHETLAYLTPNEFRSTLNPKSATS